MNNNDIYIYIYIRCAGLVFIYIVKVCVRFQMEMILPIPLVWVLWSEQGTCVPLCSRLESTWQRERCNFLIIFSWDVPVATQIQISISLLFEIYHVNRFSPLHP